MTLLPEALVELIHDPKGRRAAAQLGPFIKGLEAEGIPPRAICRALAHVLLMTCLDEYERWDEHRLWAKQFLRELEGGIRATTQDIENAEGRMLDADRNRQAGGSGHSSQ